MSMFSYPQQRKNGTVMILGAGASYGSSLDIRPPVMNNFIREGIKRVNNEYYDLLWKFLEKIGYPLDQLISGSPNLEEIYSILHVISSGLWHKNDDELVAAVGNEFWKITPVHFLESFIMEITGKSSLIALKNSCAYHDALVNELGFGDTVISFNYDLIADAAIAKNKTWTEYNGYGFLFFHQAHLDENIELLSTRSEISLLKPHGSLNWRFYPKTPIHFDPNSKIEQGNSQTLRTKLLEGTDTKHELSVELLANIEEDIYGNLAIDTAKFYDELIREVPENERWKFKGLIKPFDSSYIIPPSLYKFGNPNIPEELVRVWSRMYDALSLAGKIICVGYSFPPNDTEFNTLFRLAIRNNEQKQLKILLVNPSSEIKDKVQSLVPGKKVTHVANTLVDYIKKGE